MPTRLCFYCWFLFVIPDAISCRAGELAEIFAKEHPDAAKWNFTVLSPGARNPPPSANEQFNITEIAIEHGGCFWKCPQYVVTIRNDGALRYVGGENARPKGILLGTVSERSFTKLAQFIHDSGFMELRDFYYAPVTDSEIVFTSIVIDGKRKIVSNYAQSGPTFLWAIQTLIDKLVASAKWDNTRPENKPQFLPYD